MIDGLDIARMGLHDVRKNLAIIPQVSIDMPWCLGIVDGVNENTFYSTGLLWGESMDCR